MQREAWLDGPVEGVPALLQPVAHALLQARVEVREITEDLADVHLWVRPAGAASAGFHLQHLSGVVDRLFTYARGEALTERQLAELAAEGDASGGRATARGLALLFDARVDAAISQLRATDVFDLTSPRAVGRSNLPSTVIGLLVHAAEHTTRHVGQLLVTARLVPHLPP